MNQPPPNPRPPPRRINIKMMMMITAAKTTTPQMLAPFHGLAEQSRTALQRSRGTIEASRNLVRRASGERPLATFTRAGEKTA